MSDAGVTKAVILAGGRGTRMRRADPVAGAALSAEQAAAAAAGVKGLVPVRGRPLLDYALGALVDAGYREACLVIGPEHEAIRARYTRELRPERLTVRFATQARPIGTADAVLAAEEFSSGAPFVVVNADNLYPVAALAALRAAAPPALLGFDPEALARGGNVTAERIAGYAILDVSPDGTLRRIVEKPDAATLAALSAAGARPPVSMTCWSFTPDIFEACRRIAPSARGELELPDAVQWLVEHRGARFMVMPVRDTVLDLSSRADIAAVEALLADVEPRP